MQPRAETGAGLILWSQELLETVHIRLKPLQRLSHVIAVSGSMVAGERERQKAPAIPQYELPCFYRGEKVVLQPVTVDSEVLKGDPGEAGNGVGVGGGWGLRLG